MEIAIFNDVATSEIIDALKAEGEKYQGLYVDMNDPKQRKYVKDNASHIKNLKKQVDRKRIDVVKEFKARVEKEAASITEDLNIANLPFESLIDEYTIERKKILDAEKADRESRERAAQLEVDHEFGLLMNAKFDADKVAAEKDRLAYEEKLKAEAIEQAKQDLINAENKAKEDKARAIEQAKQAKIDAEIQQAQAVEKAIQDEIAKQIAIDEEAERQRIEREANKTHLAKINNGILSVLTLNGVDEESAKIIIRLAAKGKLPNMTINY